MPANGTIVKVDPAGPPPVMELKFGDAQWGKYEVYLWDPSGEQPALVRRGFNNDQIPDVFPVAASAAQLKNRPLTWEATIASLGGGRGQRYSLTVSFKQAGQPLTAKPFLYTGALNNVKVIADYVKFEVE
jgi:hypothetical protein